MRYAAMSFSYAIMPTKSLVDEEGNVADPAPLASTVAVGSGSIGSGVQAPHPTPGSTRTRPHRRNNIGTMTYTLVQALDVSASRKKSQTSVTFNTAGTIAPIDILVVVLSLSVDLHAGAGTGANTGGRGKGPVAELLVTDQSLPVGCCGRIRLYGRDHIKHLSGISRGDVIRFNRIDVSKDNRNETNMRSTGGTSTSKSNGNISTALSTVICEMRPSWSDPEAGIPFARVGLSPAADGNEIIVGNNDSFMSSTGEVVEPHTLPNAMVTSPSTIEELLSWFQKCHSNTSNSGGANSNIALSGPIATGVGPCRRRKLRDITNSNLLSEVVVNVVHSDAAAILSPAVVLSLCGGANKRRRNMASASQQRGYVATLSDGNEASDIMPLYDCHRFKAILESSISSGSTECSRLLITNVLSRRLAASSASTVATCSSSMILLPTPDTTIVSLSNDFLAATGAAAGSRGGATTLSSQYWDSQSQMLDNSPGRDLTSPSESKGMTGDYETKIVTSQVLDIFIDDCNQCLSDEAILADPDKLVSLLVGSRGKRSSYRNATITIDCNAAGKDSFVVKADKSIMETLCCSCPATDLTVEGKGDGAIRNDVRDLLRGFIHLDVPLEWTLQKLKKESETRRWTVVDVKVPRIDL